jgi:LAS superfamily LD-carboxypeptidase LdcB
MTRRVLGYERGVAKSIELASVGGRFELRVDAAAAWERMKAAALADSFAFTVNSAFRSHEEQKRLRALYEAGKGNLASAPGWSNHQGGTAVDIGGVGGFGTPAHAWLKANARCFGFIDDVPTEFWHWHYVGPPTETTP